jgi:hypothetical protein
MQHKPMPPEEDSQAPPIKSSSCEIIFFPGFDIRLIVQAPELWNRPAKPKIKSSN